MEGAAAEAAAANFATADVDGLGMAVTASAGDAGAAASIRGRMGGGNEKEEEEEGEESAAVPGGGNGATFVRCGDELALARAASVPFR